MPLPPLPACWAAFLPQIIHTDSNTVLGQNDTGFSCDGSASTFRVMFKEPVEVLPSVNYTACATLKVGATLPEGAGLSLQAVGTLVISSPTPRPEDFLTSL